MTTFSAARFNGSALLNRPRFHRLLCSALTALVAATALSHMTAVHSYEVDIQALFRPDPARPQHNVFTITTPDTGYCRDYTRDCTANNMSSHRVRMRITANQPIAAHHTDPRQGPMFSVPTQWRDFQVTHRQTLEQKTVQIRIKGVGGQYETSNVVPLVGGGVSAYDAHGKLWGKQWQYAPAPCTYTGSGGYNNYVYGFFWKTPEQGVCAKQAQYDIPTFRYNYLDFAYELKTPAPLDMSSGEYVGSLSYGLGPQQDFDMGDLMFPADPTLRLNVVLTVEHTLKVEVPPGGNQIELVPKDGWQRWVQTGRMAEKLFRNQTFLISASAPFKMQLHCERVIGDTCALLDNKSLHEVPLDLYVTLPNGLGREDGSPVNRQPLLLSGVGTQRFIPVRYLDRREGTLHFEIQKHHVQDMLSRSEGKYSGSVVVIWDSQV